MQAAREAASGALASYSHYRVGAALRAESGAIYSGANIESASYGLSICAERVALFLALMAGEREFTELALTGFDASGQEQPGITPCGACRQLLAEYAPGLIVHLNDGRHLTI